MSHILLGMPTSRLYPSNLSTGPVLVSHFYDLQTPSIPNPTAELDFGSSERAHTGPPAVNVEVVLKGDNVHTEGGEPLEGRLWARGPSILRSSEYKGSDGCVQIFCTAENVADISRWIDLDQVARVQTNGTFIIPPPL
jgi:long-chain acyl-CoA synthetase